jgi:hypothetical protein
MRLIRLLTASVGPLDTRAWVPGDDVLAPAHVGAAQGAHFGRAGLVLEVVAELVDEIGGELGGR